MTALIDAWWFVMRLLRLSRQRHKKGQCAFKRSSHHWQLPSNNASAVQSIATFSTDNNALSHQTSLLKWLILSLFSYQLTYPPLRAWCKTILTVIREQPSNRLTSNALSGTYWKEMCPFSSKLAPLLVKSIIDISYSVNPVFQCLTDHSAAWVYCLVMSFLMLYITRLAVHCAAAY